MPAILLTRLQEQAYGLLDVFDQPERFFKQVSELFEYYSDHVYRAGQAFESHALLDSYHVPAPLIPTLTQFLAARIAAEPEQAFELVDRLWLDRKAEAKLLAISIVGKINNRHSSEIISRASEWIRQPVEYPLLEKLSEAGLQNLLAAEPDAYLSLMETWLSSEQFSAQQAGLHGLALLIKSNSFANFPRVFKLIQPMLVTATVEIAPELAAALSALGKKSAVETSRFYHQILSVPGSAVSRSVIREAISTLPPELQNQVKGLLRTGKFTGDQA